MRILLTLILMVLACFATSSLCGQLGPRTVAQEPSQRILSHNPQTSSSIPRRVALVIGNGIYVHAPKLNNAPNDATDMAAALTGLGFTVVRATNLGQREMKNLIREFGRTLKGGGAGLFYFAGHGVQSKGHNYLIPVDAYIESEAELEDATVDLNLVLNFMDEARNDLNIVFLDACRSNPFASTFRSASDGLASVDAPTGTFIGYATAPGRVASDGPGRNGTFTAELLKQMRVPGIPLSDMFMRVRVGVMNQTSRKQVPWEASSVTGIFYFSETTSQNNNNNSQGTNVLSSAVTTVQAPIAHGPVNLGTNRVYAIRDFVGQKIQIKLSATIVYSNREDKILEMLRKNEDPSHVWDGKWYYWRLPKDAMLLLSWRNIKNGASGWVLVQGHLNAWWYKTNASEWKPLAVANPVYKYWVPGDRTVRIGIEKPQPVNGWTDNDVKYSFRH